MTHHREGTCGGGQVDNLIVGSMIEHLPTEVLEHTLHFVCMSEWLLIAYRLKPFRGMVPDLLRTMTNNSNLLHKKKNLGNRPFAENIVYLVAVVWQLEQYDTLIRRRLGIEIVQFATFGIRHGWAVVGLCKRIEHLEFVFRTKDGVKVVRVRFRVKPRLHRCVGYHYPNVPPVFFYGEKEVNVGDLKWSPAMMMAPMNNPSHTNFGWSPEWFVTALNTAWLQGQN